MSHVPRKTELEKEILNILTAGSLRAAKMAFTHDGIHTLQDYANTVSIKRLGMNDHGPVHMRISALNSLKMLDLLGKPEWPPVWDPNRVSASTTAGPRYF